MDIQKFRNELAEMAQSQFTFFPENFPRENGALNDEGRKNLISFADYVFENRDHSEVERDQEFSITRTEYYRVVNDAYNEWANTKNEMAEAFTAFILDNIADIKTNTLTRATAAKWLADKKDKYPGLEPADLELILASRTFIQLAYNV